MTDDLRSTIEYAVQPKLLGLYGMILLGELLRGAWSGAPLLRGFRGSVVFGIVTLASGLVSLGLELLGFLLVAVGVVGVLRIVALDALADRHDPNLGDVAGPDDGPDSDGRSDRERGTAAAGGK